MKTDTPRSSASRASLSLPGPAVFHVRKNFFLLLNSVLFSLSLFYQRFNFFVFNPFSLSTGHYGIILTALIFESPRLIDTPGSTTAINTVGPSKREIPNASSVAARPHLPPILWRSEVGNRSSSESTKLLLANGLISHPRSFGFFFPFPCLGSGWPPSSTSFHNGLASILQLAFFISIGRSIGISRESLAAITKIVSPIRPGWHLERFGQNMSCSSIHSGIFLFFWSSETLFHLGSVLSIFASLAFLERSMLSATWPSPIRDPWALFTKTALTVVLDPVFEG